MRPNQVLHQVWQMAIFLMFSKATITYSLSKMLQRSKKGILDKETDRFNPNSRS
jgi:hypothetical protein